MMTAIEQKALKELVAAAIQKQKEELIKFQGKENPIIKDLTAKLEGRIEALSDVYEALRGNNLYLRMYL